MVRACPVCGFGLEGRKCAACGYTVEVHLDEESLAGLPAWKADMLRKRSSAASVDKKKTGVGKETITRQRVAAEALGERDAASLRTAKLAVDELRITTFAPSRQLQRFGRSVDAASCAPMVLSILTELLGLRLFGKLSEVCTSWYDGVRDKEDEWAVVKLKLDGMLGEGTGASQGHLDLPTYATMLPGASICVCDSGNARLQTFTPTGRVKGVFNMSKGVKGGHLSMPCTVVCDVPRKLLFVVLSHGKLLKYRVLHGVGGRFVNFERAEPRKSTSASEGAGWECESCTYLHAGVETDCSMCARCGKPRAKDPALEAMAVDAPEGAVLLGRTLFVTCARWHRLVGFDTESLVPLRAFGRHGRGLGQLRCPQGLAALDHAEQRELYVADMHNDRIAIFSPQGACLGEIGFRGTGPGQFIYPRGVAIVRHELLVVAERQRVQVLSLIGEPRQVLRVPMASRLSGICVTERQVTWTGRHPQAQTFLYIADLDEGRVHAFEVAGRTQVEWEVPTELHTTLGSMKLNAGVPHPPGAGGAAANSVDAASEEMAAWAQVGREEAAAARAEARKGQLAEGYSTDTVDRAQKIRKRTKLLRRINKHPRGDVGDRLLDTLELPINASTAAVDHTIRLVMRVLHPDYSINLEAKGSALGKELEAAFQKIADLRDKLQVGRAQQLISNTPYSLLPTPSILHTYLQVEREQQRAERTAEYDEDDG